MRVLTYQSVLLPLDALLLVGIRVGITLHGAGVTAEQAMQSGSDLVAAASLDGVALGTTGLEQTSTLLSISCATVSMNSQENAGVSRYEKAGLGLESDDPMARFPEPLPFPSQQPTGSEPLSEPQRRSYERSAAFCEAWLQLRRECDSLKCLRRGTLSGTVASVITGLGIDARTDFECADPPRSRHSGREAISRLNGGAQVCAVSGVDVPSLKGILSRV